MDQHELVSRIASTRGISTSAVRLVVDAILDEQLSIVSLRHAAWQSEDDHSLIEIDGDEDYVPPRSVPLWQSGSTAIGLPSLEFLEEGEDDDG